MNKQAKQKLIGWLETVITMGNRFADDIDPKRTFKNDATKHVDAIVWEARHLKAMLESKDAKA